MMSTPPLAPISTLSSPEATPLPVEAEIQRRLAENLIAKFKRFYLDAFDHDKLIRQGSKDEARRYHKEVLKPRWDAYMLLKANLEEYTGHPAGGGSVEGVHTVN